MREFRREPVLREDDLHWLDEGISQSEEDRGARYDGDEGPNQRGKDIAMDSSTSSGDNEDGGNGGEKVSGDESDDSKLAIIGETPVLSSIRNLGQVVSDSAWSEMTQMPESLSRSKTRPSRN